MRALSILLAAALAATPAAVSAASQARFDAAVERTKSVMLANPKAAVELARTMEPVAASIRKPQARARALATSYWLRAEALERGGETMAAAPIIERARDIASTAAPNSSLLANILLVRGSISGKRLASAEALSDFQNAHRLFRANGDARREAIALICIADLYLEARDYKSALRYLDEALEAFPADSGLAYAIHNTRGRALGDQRRFAEADVAFQNAVHHARLVKSVSLQGMFLRNMVRNQLMAGQVGRAERTLESARRFSTTEEDATQLDVLTAQALLQRGRVGEAGRLIDQTFIGVDMARTDVGFRYAHLTAVGAYRALRRTESALAHLEALKRLDDEAAKLATETSTALMAARFDSANQEAKIQRLRDAERLREAREALQRAQNERELFLIVGAASAVVLLLLLIGLVTIRRSRDQVRAANGDLEVTNAALGKALAAKTEFLATTSHEIRTPLNGILGMTQVMLADDALAAPTRDRLTVVHGAGLTMRALVDDILDVAKMETGHLALDCEPFDLPACLNEAAAIWAEQARAKGLRFAIDFRDCPARVEGDAARVRQIVFNLLSNALKFTATGSVSVTASGTPDGVRIAVSDTGIGIAADKQAEVFESFRQADASTTRRFGGTGLGLSICRSLATAMGGGIALRSRPGEGSTFIVTLPLRTVAAEPVAAATACPTLLIVDRNPITRAMFRVLFAGHAQAIAFAGTVAEAIERLRGGDVCQVLIDDATARVAGDPIRFVSTLVVAADAVPVTLLWPVAAAAEREELITLGLARLVAKPVTGLDLVHALFPSDLDPLVSQAA